MKISGNTILITGGTSGIGFEMAKQLLAKGNQIIITGRDQARLQKAKQALPKIHIIRSDVSKTQDIQALYTQVTKEFPALNILINNAGIMKTVNLQNGVDSLDSLTEEIEINLNGPIRMTKIFLQHLKNKEESAIINVSSGLAFVPLPTTPVYCATKAGLHSFTQSLRVQLKNTNVKVFELAPPATETELLAGTMSAEDRRGVSVMSVQKMVEVAVQGLTANKFEIRPGQSNQLKFMSRVAPEFILKQLSKPVERMHASK
jgi:uncharacterized oxidoreductase